MYLNNHNMLVIIGVDLKIEWPRVAKKLRWLNTDLM